MEEAPDLPAKKLRGKGAAAAVTKQKGGGATPPSDKGFKTSPSGSEPHQLLTRILHHAALILLHISGWMAVESTFRLLALQLNHVALPLKPVQNSKSASMAAYSKSQRMQAEHASVC